MRVTKRKFKSIELVDIRKFYTTDDDEVKPGRQGLSLTMSQWETLGKFKTRSIERSISTRKFRWNSLCEEKSKCSMLEC